MMKNLAHDRNSKVRIRVKSHQKDRLTKDELQKQQKQIKIKGVQCDTTPNELCLIHAFFESRTSIPNTKRGKKNMCLEIVHDALPCVGPEAQIPQRSDFFKIFLPL